MDAASLLPLRARAREQNREFDGVAATARTRAGRRPGAAKQTQHGPALVAARLVRSVRLRRVAAPRGAPHGPVDQDVASPARQRQPQRALSL